MAPACEPPGEPIALTARSEPCSRSSMKPSSTSRAREALLDAALGEARFVKTAARLREGRLPADGLSLVARAKRRVIGSVRAVERLGRTATACTVARTACGRLRLPQPRRGRGTDAPRPGARRGDAGMACRAARGRCRPTMAASAFRCEKTQALWLPGPYERDRLLARELAPGTLDGAHGLVRATGRREPRPELSTLVAGLISDRNAPRAA